MMTTEHPPTIQEATAAYESWLGGHITLLPEDLAHKHAAMASGVFPFLRATFYRWTQLWPRVCGSLCEAATVLTVGDLHIENFGTWRDAEGRLVWGINDFDEAFHLPYTNDLVRLATSAHLAIADGGLAIAPKDGDAAILAGYKECLEAGGRAVVLAEHWRALRRMATERLKDPERFWQKLDALPLLAAERVPADAVAALAALLPAKDLPLRYGHRIAGLGSLGRERYVAIADWHGGRIAREAKAAAPSACVWARHASHANGESKVLYQTILEKSVRCPDPFVMLKQRWIVRRLAPDCSRIELAELPEEQDAVRLLHSMGWETANVHLGSANAKTLLLDLASHPQGWLHAAAKEMREVVTADWEAWRGPVKKEGKAAKNQPVSPK